MISQKPSVGRIVHYVSYGTPGGEYSRECRAAIITQVADPAGGILREPQTVGLCVFNPTGQFFNPDVYAHPGGPDDAGGTNLCEGLDYPGGTWHWPART